MNILGTQVNMTSTQVLMGVAGLALGYWMVRKGDKKMITKAMYIIGGGLLGIGAGVATDAVVYKVKNKTWK